jgi:hypothetical protein
LHRLHGDGPVDVEREEIVDGRLRRYYRLTPSGAELLAAEVARLSANTVLAPDSGRVGQWFAASIASTRRNPGRSHGVRTMTGATWKPTTVRDALRRPRDAGILEYWGEEIGTGRGSRSWLSRRTARSGRPWRTPPA